MKNRRMLQLGLVTVVLGMSLVGCGTDESDNKTEKTEATEQVTVTEENTTGEDAADISADDTEDIADTYDESTELRFRYMMISHWSRDSARNMQIWTTDHLCTMVRSSY